MYQALKSHAWSRPAWAWPSAQELITPDSPINVKYTPCSFSSSPSLFMLYITTSIYVFQLKFASLFQHTSVHPSPPWLQVPPAPPQCTFPWLVLSRQPPADCSRESKQYGGWLWRRHLRLAQGQGGPYTSPPGSWSGPWLLLLPIRGGGRAVIARGGGRSRGLWGEKCDPVTFTKTRYNYRSLNELLGLKIVDLNMRRTSNKKRPILIEVSDNSNIFSNQCTAL